MTTLAAGTQEYSVVLNELLETSVKTGLSYQAPDFGFEQQS